MTYSSDEQQIPVGRRVFLARLSMGAVGAGLFLAGCGDGGITNSTDGAFSNSDPSYLNRG